MSDLEAVNQPAVPTATDISLERYIERHPAAASSRLAKFPVSEISELLNQLSVYSSARLLANFPDSLSDKLIRGASIETLAGWISLSQPDDAITIVGRISRRQRQALMKHQTNNRLLAERINQTNDADIANLLQIDFFRTSEDATLEELISELKQRKRTAHRSIFVVDGSGRYKGIIELSKALTAEPHRRVREFVKMAQPVLITDAPAKAVRCSSWNLYRELPVVDEQQRLISSLLWSDLQRQLSRHSADKDEQEYVNGLLEQGLGLTAQLMTPLLDTLYLIGRKS